MSPGRITKAAITTPGIEPEPPRMLTPPEHHHGYDLKLPPEGDGGSGRTEPRRQADRSDPRHEARQ